MKLFQMNEAPIGDYAPLGNWGDNEKSNSFSHNQDRRLIQSDSLIKKVKKKFNGIEQTINMYFINLPGLRKFSETGIMSAEAISKDMPEAWELLSQRERSEGTDPENSINIIYVGNAGVNRVPMTAWIIAHRLGHAINASSNKAMSWRDFEEEVFDLIKLIFDQVYDVILYKNDFYVNKDLAKFFQQIGTMSSARNNNLGGRPYEFLYEIFAQYISTKSIKFNNLPEYLIYNGRSYKADEEAMLSWSNSIGANGRDHYDIIDQIEERINNIFYDIEGKYLVM